MPDIGTLASLRKSCNEEFSADQGFSGLEVIESRSQSHIMTVMNDGKLLLEHSNRRNNTSLTM